MALPSEPKPGDSAESSPAKPGAPPGPAAEERHEDESKGGSTKSDGKTTSGTKDCGKSRCEESDGGRSGGDGNAGHRTDPGSWSSAQQLAFAIVVVFVVAGLVLYPPIYTSRLLIEAGVDTAGALDVWAPMLAVFVALTSVTISGTFIFMTFRIDRGTKQKAREVAENVAGKVADAAARKVADKVAKRVSEKMAEKTAKDLRGDVDLMKKEMERRLRDLPDRVSDAADKVTAIRDTAQRSADRVEETVVRVTEKAAKFDEFVNEKAKAVVQEAVNSALDDDEGLQQRIRSLIDPSELKNQIARRIQEAINTIVDDDKDLQQRTRNVIDSFTLDRALFEEVARRALKDLQTTGLEERLHKLMSRLEKRWLPWRMFWRKRTTEDSS